MKDLARQLEHVRRRAKMLLLAQRIGQVAGAAVPVFLSLALLDFLLRLPGWLRAVVAGGLVVFAAVWLGRRLLRAWRFGPSLSELALRLERLYPRLAGRLSSALDFGTHPERYDRPATTAALARQSVAAAERELTGVRVTRLLDWTRTRRLTGFVVGSVLLLAGCYFAMPTHSAIAASRWLTPWGDAAWPKRTQVVADDPGAFRQVRPVDSPVEFTARVTRGFRPGMRVWLHVQRLDPHTNEPAGPSEALLMTEQSDLGVVSAASAAAGPDAGLFRLLWRPPAEVSRRVTSGEADAVGLRVWFVAGDDRTEPQPLTLVARPALAELRAAVEPPAYAAGLVPAQSAALHQQTDRVVSLPAFEGSRVTLNLRTNKPLPDDAMTAERLLPGLAGLGTLGGTRPSPDTAVVSFVLDRTVQTPARLTDAFGLSNPDERSFRFDRREDRLPTAAILEPSADASVLATAILPIVAQATDDVGVRRLSITADHPDRAASRSEATVQTAELAEAEARAARVTADAVLDLSTLTLAVGDVVTVNAAAHDVFELHGRRHDPAHATPRRLRIIDEATLIAQVRADLAGVRQQAVRLEQQQDQLQRRAADAPASLQPEQARVSRALDSQLLQLDRVRDRLQLNRLREAALDELIRQADELARDAQRASSAAEQALDEAAAASQNADAAAAEEAVAEAKNRAGEQQAAAREKLEDLARLLDQGRDALGLRLELARLRTEQEALAQDTRELLPRTVGQDTSQLPEELQQALRELADRQRELADQSDAAIEQLQSTAESLARQSENDADRAAAEALAEAAAVAQRQGLDRQMRESQSGLENNRLSQAGQAQLESLDTLDQMMQQLGDQDQLRQELLRRRLLALAEKLRRLIEGQTLANTATSDAAADAALPALADAQSRLWVRSIAVQTEAEADQETAEAAPIVGQAVDAQAAALAALRGSRRADTEVGQRVALERLEAALAKIEELQAQAQQDQTQQQRAELRQKYLELAERQRALRDEVAPLLDEFPLTRRTRAALRGLAQTQGELRDAAAELGEEVGETIVFRQTHASIDAAAEQAQARLARGDDDGVVLPRQRRVVVLLESMAEALNEQGDPPEFADASGGGAGGGGDAGGPPPPLVPNTAELKLLRGVQQAVYDETRALAESIDDRPTAPQTRRLDDLAGQQRELSDLGRRLIQQMSRQRAPVATPPIQPDPERRR